MDGARREQQKTYSLWLGPSGNTAEALSKAGWTFRHRGIFEFRVTLSSYAFLIKT